MQILRSLNEKEIAVAVSGGLDSLSVLHWMKQRKRTIAVHYVHDSPFALTELEFVERFCYDNAIPLLTAKQKQGRPLGVSQEEYWRNGRYNFFRNLPFTVCTGHTLDDAVEWYLFSSFHGQGRYMDYRHDNVIRPFITTKKTEIMDYAARNKLEWLEDPSNQDVNFASRNRIRHEILPLALQINPGLYNMVKKRINEKTPTEKRKKL